MEFGVKTDAKQHKNTHSNVEYYHIRRQTSNLLGRNSLMIRIAAGIPAAVAATAEFPGGSTATSTGCQGSGVEATQRGRTCRQATDGKVWRGEAIRKALGEEELWETAVKGRGKQGTGRVGEGF